jgi:hypothetical protein
MAMWVKIRGMVCVLDIIRFERRSVVVFMLFICRSHTCTWYFDWHTCLCKVNNCPESGKIDVFQTLHTDSVYRAGVIQLWV